MKSPPVIRVNAAHVGYERRELVVASAQATDEQHKPGLLCPVCALGEWRRSSSWWWRTNTDNYRAASGTATHTFCFAPNRHQNMASDSKHTAQLKSGEYRGLGNVSSRDFFCVSTHTQASFFKANVATYVFFPPRAELYFLIARFLEAGPCQDSAEVRDFIF